MIRDALIVIVTLAVGWLILVTAYTTGKRTGWAECVIEAGR